MESWCVGYDGDDDVERHAGTGPYTRNQPSETSSSIGKPRLHLKVASDYICPWCFVGFTRIEQLRDEFDIDLETCAYELRPGIPLEGISRKVLMKDRVYPEGYLENLRATAAASGINLKRPAIVPNTRLAHEATEFAREHGKLWEIHRALFHSYFEEEQNIGDIDVVVSVGERIGLDPSSLRHALASHRYATEVQQQLDWSRAVGITGVPTVIFNQKFALVGAQDQEVFSSVAHRILNREVSAL